MKVLGRFRRNHKSSRTPTQEEVNANLDLEGNPNAKLQPHESHETELQQPQPQPNLHETQTPRWSNYSKNNNNNHNINPNENSSYTNTNTNHKQTDDFQENDGDYNLMVDGKPVYIVKQKRGYLSILFSLIQTGVLIAMMVQCGVAPMNINRKFLTLLLQIIYHISFIMLLCINID